MNFNINNIKYWEKHFKYTYRLGVGEETFFTKLLEIAKKSSKILEIGVGKGRMVNILRKNRICAKFYGVDLTNNIINSDTIGVLGDARILPFKDNTFDLVYSLGVIEHFPETQLAVEEHLRVVKKDGYVLITTPHLSIFSPLRYLIYLIRAKKLGPFEEIWGRSIRLNEIKKYCVDSNLQIQSYGFYGVYGIGKFLNKYNYFNRFQLKNYIGSYLYILGRKQ